jgi:cobyric acid synthase
VSALSIQGVSSSAGKSCVADDLQAFASGSVLGVTAHGILSDPSMLLVLIGSLPARELEDVFDALADLVEERLDIPALGRLAGVDL